MPRRHHGNRFRQHWTRDSVIAAVQQWKEIYREVPRRTDWDPWRCNMLADAAEEKARVWRARAQAFAASPEWPSVRTVIELFGSWNAAIEAAGFVARMPSQNTPRGTVPSPFLTPLGHAMRLLYEAEDEGDFETVRIRLFQVAAIATELAESLTSEEALLAAQMGEDL